MALPLDAVQDRDDVSDDAGWQFQVRGDLGPGAGAPDLGEGHGEHGPTRRGGLSPRAGGDEVGPDQLRQPSSVGVGQVRVMVGEAEPASVARGGGGGVARLGVAHSEQQLVGLAELVTDAVDLDGGEQRVVGGGREP